MNHLLLLVDTIADFSELISVKKLKKSVWLPLNIEQRNQALKCIIISIIDINGKL